MRSWRRRAGLAAAGLAVAVGIALVFTRGSAPDTGLHSGAPTTTAVLPRPVTPPGPRPAPAPAAEQFGADVNRVFENQTFTAAQVQAQLAALRSTGATIARTDALWEYAEPQAPAGDRHRYDWSFDDRVAGDLAANGLRWLPIIDYSPSWVQSVPGLDHSPPRSDADYADYAAAVAARYGPGGAFWSAHPRLTALAVQAVEVWNEPDNPTFWSPSPDPARYAELYVQTRDTVAAAAPGVHVLIGGLFQAPRFLPALLEADPALAGHVDGVSVHPYGATPAIIVAHVAADRRLLDALGLGSVPLYVTEFGWTTSPPGARDYLPAAQRPANLTGTLTGLASVDCGVAAVIAYTWVTEQLNPADSQQWYGILGPGAAPGPDAAAFASGLRDALALSRHPGACPAG